MKTKIIILLSAMIMLLSLNAHASNAAAVLENGVGVRAIAMGMSQVAIAHDGYAAYWNPAGLKNVSGSEINSMMASIFGVIDQNFLGYAFHYDDKVFGVFYTSAGVQGIEESTYNSGTHVISLTGSKFAYEASAIYFSVAGSLAQLNNLLLENRETNFGVSLKLVSEQLQDKSASGIGLDLGIITKFDNQLSWGVQIQNLLSPTLKWSNSGQSGESLPTIVKTGLGYFLNKKTLLSIDFDYKFIKDDGLLLHYGVEYQLWQAEKASMAVRGGLNGSKIAFGLGLEYQGFKGDYVFEKAPSDYMNDSHRFALGYCIPKVSQEQKMLNSEPIQQTVTEVSEAQSITPEYIESKIEAVQVTNAEKTVPISETLPEVKAKTKPLLTNIFGDYEPEIVKEIVKPVLTVELPRETVTVTKSIIGIRGKAMNTKMMLINEKEVWCNASGLFFVEMALALGENIINFRAISRTGDEFKITRKIFRK